MTSTTPVARPPNPDPWPNGPPSNGPVGTVAADPYKADTVGEREPPFVNPPIVSALSHTPFDLTEQPLQRGYLAEDPPEPNDIPIDKRYRLNFHFNPDTINETWDIDFSADMTDLQSLPTIGGIRPKGVTFSFQLILDRTRFEQAHPEGVMADTRILSKIVTKGMGGPESQSNAIFPSGVKVVFGPGGVGTNFGRILKNPWLKDQWLRSPLGATGLILGYGCQYTRFNKLMVPTRAVVELTIRVNYWLPSTATDPAYTANSDAGTRGGSKGGVRIGNKPRGAS